MRPVSLGALNDQFAIVQALRQIENASRDDIQTVADAYTITGTLTETRELDVDTPSLANLAAVLGTLIYDLKRRGQHKQY